MVASPKLSQWFYLYEACNRPLPARDDQLPTGRRVSPAPPPRSRGFAADTRPRKRFTEPQRQTILDLIREHPRSPSTVKEQFAEAWPDLTVTRVTIHKIKHKAIEAGKLQLQ
jgi:hypothetical protein